MSKTKKVITLSRDEVNQSVLRGLGLEWKDVEFVKHQLELKDDNGNIMPLRGSISVNKFVGNISITFKDVEVHLKGK